MSIHDANSVVKDMMNQKNSQHMYYQDGFLSEGHREDKQEEDENSIHTTK